MRGVVAASTGNHGAAVAYAARIAKVGATIFLPENPNPVKRARIVALGAKVIERGAMGSSAASEAAAEFAREHGHYFSARPCSRGRCSRSQPLLNNPDGILKKFGWQAARRIPFTNVREIVEMKPILKAYIHEATEAEKAGLKVNFKTNPEPIPEELQNTLDEIPALKTAFNALTPGRQRGYILYFSGAKQSKTRESRVEKCMLQILKGKGLND